MPESGRRVFATHTVRISKTVAAPLGYVYGWCTDFREDDGRLSRSRPRFKVLRVAKNRVVRIRASGSRDTNARIAVEVVRLKPPNAWHLDQIDEIDLNSVDYKLTRLGPRKTRVHLLLTERWMVPKYPKRSEWSRGTSKYWDDLVAAIERDYRAGRPALG